MKRIATFITLFAAICSSAVAQDMLVKRNGEKMRVTVLEVTKKKIKFVRHLTQMPVYTLPISDIDYIEYPDGERDTFGKPAKVTPAPAATPAPQPVAKAEPQRTATYTDPAAERYDIGSYYCKDGIEGIVIATTDGGTHGTIISIDEADAAWTTIERKQITATGCTDRIDGRVNMKTLEEYISRNNLSWSDFPAANWCRNKGEGWYLPALNEIWQLGTVVNGGSRTSARREVRRQYNSLLKECNGKPLNPLMFYYSSTEATNPKLATYSHCNPDPPHTGETSKTDRLFIRAFHRF